MPIRSHVDFCLFAQTVHVHGNDVPPDMVELLAHQLDADMAASAWDSLAERRRAVMFHEGYHIWQGARLPFLHWYGIFAFRSILQSFRALDAIERLEDWEIFVPALYRLDLTWHAWWTQDRRMSASRELAEPPPDVVGDARLSVIDLLEGAASMAEFQVMVKQNEAVDPGRFKRHTKRHPAYVDAYRFLARYLADDRLAMRVLIPMVCRAFTTTDPVRAFFALAAGLDKARAADFVCRPGGAVHVERVHGDARRAGGGTAIRS